MYIIGIAGGTGSGKTTVVKRIASVLPPHCAAVVPLDSYYNDTTGMTDEERKAINFDHPDAFDWKLLTEHIKMLKSGQAVEQPTYSYLISNRLQETIHVEPKPVIILEGIMTLHYKKLRDMMDLKIFVDTDSDVRLIRNIRRDVVERGRTVDMVLDRYEKVLKPTKALLPMYNGEKTVEESGATTLFLVRHGETVDNARQIMQGQTQGCLNEKGREQAQQVAQRLAGEAIDAVVASDLHRAIQTAEIIAAPHGLPVRTTKLLRERDWGGFTGRYIPDLKGEVWPDDIESEQALLQRAADFLQYITATYPGKRVMAVGHGIINKAILSVYAGCTMREVQRMMNAEVRILTTTAERTAASAAAAMAATAAAASTKTSTTGAATAGATTAATAE